MKFILNINKIKIKYKFLNNFIFKNKYSFFLLKYSFLITKKYFVTHILYKKKKNNKLCLN
jgi:hypothetical protein